MCQKEILLVLKIEDRWMTSTEICDQIPYVGYVSVSRALKQMVIYKEINVRTKENTKHQNEYKAK